MTSSVTVKPVRGVRGIGTITIIVGIIMLIAGAVTYAMVTTQLRDENITVSEDAQFLGGHTVQDPLTAYAQAEVINKHALEMTDGKTYAELSQDDPQRATVMNASFLRASLFTSVVAFGVAAFVFVCGILFILFGSAFRRLGRGDVTVLDVVAAGAAPDAAAPVAPAQPAVAQAAPAAPAAPVAPTPVAPAVPAAEPPVRSSVHSTPAAAARAAAPEEVPAAAVPDSAASTEPGVDSAAADPAPPSAPPVQANDVHAPTGGTDGRDVPGEQPERPAGA